MKTQLTILSLVLLLSACGSPSASIEVKEQQDTLATQPIENVEKHFTPDELPTDASTEGISRPTSWAFNGQIADKHDIYLTLTKSEDVAKDGCYKVYGSYRYLNTLRPISIEGSYCPEAGSFEFKHKEDKTIDERFKGQIDKSSGKLSGTWTKVSGKNKALPLKLVNMEKQYSKKELQSFMHQIGKDLSKKQGSPETCSAEAAGIDKTGPFIYQFDPSWNGDISVFSAIQFDCYSEYNSSARGSYEHESYNLLQGTPCTYLYINSSTSLDKGDYETGDGASEITFFSLQVFQEQEPGVFKDITKSAFPSNVKTKLSTQDDEPQLEYEVVGPQILLSGKKYRWTGEKFEVY